MLFSKTVFPASDCRNTNPNRLSRNDSKINRVDFKLIEEEIS